MKNLTAIFQNYRPMLLQRLCVLVVSDVPSTAKKKYAITITIYGFDRSHVL